MEHLVLAFLLTWSGMTSAGENCAAPKPRVTKFDQTEDGVLLQCDVQGASPRPEVEWWDIAGNVLPAEEKHVRETGGSYHVTLQMSVTRRGFYRCVAKQKDGGWQTHAQEFVIIRGNHVQKWHDKYSTVGNFIIIGMTVLVVVTVAVAVAVLVRKWIKRTNRGPTPEPREHLELNNKEMHDG